MLQWKFESNRSHGHARDVSKNSRKFYPKMPTYLWNVKLNKGVDCRRNKKLKQVNRETKVLAPPCFLTDWKFWGTEKLKFKIFEAEILLRFFHPARLNFSVKCFQMTFLIVFWLFGRQKYIIGGGFDLFFDLKIV